MEENRKEWYVVNTYAGHENRVKENLQRRIETMGIENNLFRILVAEEPEIEIKANKKVEKTPLITLIIFWLLFSISKDFVASVLKNSKIITIVQKYPAATGLAGLL